MKTQMTCSIALFSLMAMAATPAISQPAPAATARPMRLAQAAPVPAPRVVAPPVLASPVPVSPDLSAVQVPLDPGTIAELDELPLRLAQAGVGQGQGRGVASPRVIFAGGESSMYQAGLSMLDSEQWQRAVEMFDRVISARKTHVDGAMYWKAYALNRLGQRNDALTALQELTKAYPSSRYLEDAKALEIEVKQNLGQPAKPEDHANDDLKLLAMSSLMRSDPEKAIPLLEQMLKGHDSPKVK